MNSKGHEKLIVWQKALKLSSKLYTIGKCDPEDHNYELIYDMTRTSVLIMARISEGYHSGDLNEYIANISMAHGFTNKLKVYFDLLNKQNYFAEDDYKYLTSMLEEISKMLKGLERALDKKLGNNRKFIELPEPEPNPWEPRRREIIDEF